jgi:hypothetical protein
MMRVVRACDMSFLSDTVTDVSNFWVHDSIPGVLHVACHTQASTHYPIKK